MIWCFVSFVLLFGIFFFSFQEYDTLGPCRVSNALTVSYISRYLVKSLKMSFATFLMYIDVWFF